MFGYSAACCSKGLKWLKPGIFVNSFLQLTVASFLGPAQLPSLTVRKSGRGPGIFYHVSNVKGREKAEKT